MTNATTVLVGVFEDEITARAVQDELTDAGFRAHAGTAEMLAAEASRGGAGLSGDVHRDSASRGVAGFFRSLFGTDEADAAAGSYADAVIRGGVAVTVSVEDDRMEEAMNILHRHRPVDIDQRLGQSPIRVVAGTPAAGDTPRVAGNEGRASTAADEGYTTDFRKHFDTEYGNRGESWGAYEPAYSYGYRSASEARFRERGWNDSEAELRAAYLGRNPAGDWDKLKSAIRYGFERARPAPRWSDHPDFQRHFHSNYEGLGLDWTAYAPAYEFGARMAREPRYRGRTWEEAESLAKTDYLRENPDSRWDNIKGAVRYAWEHVTGRR